jgi:hypothetical protein
MTATTRENDVVANVHSTTVQLPPGTYRVDSCANGVVANTFSTSGCPTPATQVTLSAPGTVTAPPASIVATRSLSGQQNAVAGWDGVSVLQGTSWVQYAQSYQGFASWIPVPPVGPPNTHQLYGSNSNQIVQNASGVYALVDATYEATQLKDLAAQGTQVVRTNLPWAFLETSRNVWDPTVVAGYDQFFSLAHSLGMKVVVEMGSTPCWASSAPPTVRNGCSSSLNGAQWPPSNYADLTSAVKWMMNRWGYATYGVEPWNEPNWNASANHPPCTNAYWGAPTYVQLLKTTYAAVKSVNPAILVGAGTLSMPDTTYLDCLYNDGVKGYYDAIDVHPYQLDFQQNPGTTGDPLKPFPVTDSAMDNVGTGMENLHDDMLTHADNSPVWITETGFSTCSAASPLCVSTSQQAQWLKESFQIFARWNWVTLGLAYTSSDTTTNTADWNSNFGLMYYGSLVPKPSLTTTASTWTCLHAGTC